MKGGTRMNKRGTGVALCGIAAFLFAARYITAAIFMSGVSSWSNQLFFAGLAYQGTALLTGSIVSLLAGIAYLVWAEIEARRPH